jgi:hypothetical protein
LIATRCASICAARLLEARGASRAVAALVPSVCTAPAYWRACVRAAVAPARFAFTGAHPGADGLLGHAASSLPSVSAALCSAVTTLPLAAAADARALLLTQPTLAATVGS